METTEAIMVYVPNWCSFPPRWYTRTNEQGGNTERAKPIELFSLNNPFVIGLQLLCFESKVQTCFSVQLSLSPLDVLDLKQTNQKRLVCRVNPLLLQMAPMLLACSLWTAAH